MNEVYPNIWQTEIETPFPGLNTRAYFIRRKSGNALFYNTSSADAMDEIEQLGGLDFQFLTHRHESGTSLKQIKERFNSQLCTSKTEAPFIDASVDVVVTEPVSFGHDIEVILTPGHTDGGLSFVYYSPGGIKYLFTGDTLFQSNKEWSTFIVPSDGGSRGELLETLELYRDLKPDVVISSGYVGERCIVEIQQSKWSKTIDQIAASV